jgi:hypothetical protein
LRRSWLLHSDPSGSSEPKEIRDPITNELLVDASAEIEEIAAEIENSVSKVVIGQC